MVPNRLGVAHCWARWHSHSIPQSVKAGWEGQQVGTQACQKGQEEVKDDDEKGVV